MQALQAEGIPLTCDVLENICLTVSAGEPVRYTRATLGALNQKQFGSFDAYLSAFETQAAYVRPSEAEKLEVFRRGLLTSLRNRVLLRPDLSEYTTWNSLIKACRAFAEANLQSRDLPSVASAVPAAAKTAATLPQKRPASGPTPPNPDSRRQKKLAAARFKEQAAASSAEPSGALSSAVIRRRAVRLGCEKLPNNKKLCFHCLQPLHIRERGVKCTRPEGKPVAIFGGKAWDELLKAAKEEAGRQPV